MPNLALTILEAFPVDLAKPEKKLEKTAELGEHDEKVKTQCQEGFLRQTDCYCKQFTSNTHDKLVPITELALGRKYPASGEIDAQKLKIKSANCVVVSLDCRNKEGCNTNISPR